MRDKRESEKALRLQAKSPTSSSTFRIIPSHIFSSITPTHHESHNFITNYYHNVLSRMGRRHPDEAETKAGTSFSMSHVGAVIKAFTGRYWKKFRVSCHGDDFLAGGSQGGSEADRPPLPGPQGVFGGAQGGRLYMSPVRGGLLYYFFLSSLFLINHHY